MEGYQNKSDTKQGRLLGEGVGEESAPRRENEDNNVITDLVPCSTLSRRACALPGNLVDPRHHLRGGLPTEKQLQEGQQVAQGHGADRRRSPNVHSRGAFSQYVPHGRMSFSPRLTPQLNPRLGTTYWKPELCATFQGLFW